MFYSLILYFVCLDYLQKRGKMKRKKEKEMDIDENKRKKRKQLQPEMPDITFGEMAGLESLKDVSPFTHYLLLYLYV